MTPGQLAEDMAAWRWRDEHTWERSAWTVHWILKGWHGNEAPSVDVLLGRAKPPLPDAGLEVLKIVDPERYREYRWAEEHGTTLD